MSFKDRTAEFTSIASAIRAQKPHLANKARPSKPLSSKSEFAQIAAQIGKQTHETTQKLVRLTQLARKPVSLFDDPEEEINDLTSTIKEDIQSINQQIVLLQQLKTNARTKQANVHSETVINTLKTKLFKATKKFQEILTVRTEKIKSQQERRQKFTGTTTMPLSRKAESPLYKVASGSYDGSSGETVIAMPPQQLELHQPYDHIARRATAVQNIQQTIGELQTIFQTVAQMVAEQGEVVERINANVLDAEANVQGAQSALITKLSSVSKNRMLILKLFGITVFFVVIFVAFFA